MVIEDAPLGLAGLPPRLAVISAAPVFMGAMSCNGGAPHFMVKAMAGGRGLRMPGFDGHRVCSCAVMLPLLFVMAWIWMH